MSFYTFIVDDINNVGQDLQAYLADHHEDYFLCYHGEPGRCPSRGPHYHIVLPGPLDGNPAVIASRCRFYRRYQDRGRVSGRRTYGYINNFIEYLLRPPRLLTAHQGLFLRIVADIRAGASTSTTTQLPNDSADGPPEEEPGRRRGRPSNEDAAAARNGRRTVEKHNQKAGLKGEELRILQDLVQRSHAKSKGALVRWVKKHGTSEEWTFVYDVLTAKGMRDFDAKFRTAIQLSEMEYLDQTWENLLKQCDDDLFPSDKYHSVGTSRQLISRWFDDQNIDLWKFVEGTIPIFDKKRKKKNTIVFHGEKNSGKTLIAQSLCESMLSYGIITNNASASFTFQDVLDKRSMLIEELVIGANQTEEMKSIMGGEPVMIQVKCKPQAYLDRTPVVITCNTYPWCAVGGGPIYEARCLMYKNLRELSWLAGYTKKIHPRVWLYYVETICESQRRFATDMDLQIEATSPNAEETLPEIPLRYIVNLDFNENNEEPCRQQAQQAVNNFNNISDEQLDHNRQLIADMEWFFGHPTEKDIQDAELAALLTPPTALAPDTPDSQKDYSRYDEMPYYSPVAIPETPDEPQVFGRTVSEWQKTPVNYYGSPIATWRKEAEMPPPPPKKKSRKYWIREMLNKEPEQEVSDDELFEL